MNEIEIARNKEPSQENIKHERNLQLKEYLKRNDMIWQQRSRELWLKDGDTNTKSSIYPLPSRKILFQFML